MGNKGKGFALALVIVMAISSLSLFMVKPVGAQSISSLSVPQFTWQYVDNSYTVQPRTVTTTDPYTGKQTTTNIMGMYVQNESIYVIILNQPFTPYVDSSGNTVNLFYDVRWKGHFGTIWTDLLPYYLATQDNNSQYTNVILGFAGNTYGGSGGQVGGISPNPDVGSEIDFQVEAYIGYFASFTNQTYQDFTGQTSGWSSTQTITIPAGSISSSPTSTPTPTQTATPSPTVPEFPAIAILPLLLSAFSISVMLAKKRLINRS